MSSCLLKPSLVVPELTCLICNCNITHFTRVFKFSTDNKKVCEKFRRIACRYFKFKCDDVKSENTINVAYTNENQNKTEESDRLCERCLPLVESFCDIYHEFSYIEQLFRWRIKEITDLIGIKIQNGDKIGKPQTQELSTSANEERKNVTDFRNKFLNQGKQHFLNAIPKVKLVRLSTKSTILNQTSNNDQCKKYSKHIQIQNTVKKEKGENKTEINSGSPKFTCKNCGKSFTKYATFNVHMRIHTGVKPFKCQYCGQRFAIKGNLRVHERIHSGVNPYKCKLCNKEFRYVKQFKIHQKENCPKRDKTELKKVPEKLENVSRKKTEVICKFCGKSVHRSRLDIHERTHTGVKPYKCKVCGKAFATGGNRNTHERLHSGVKPYKCDICGKTFRHTSTLNGHKRSQHDDENLAGKTKPSHKCKICNKTFEKASHKTIHERSHSQERPYECDECGLTFKTQASHRKHQVSHNTSKESQLPFQCKFCKQRFSSRGCCNMHHNKCPRHLEQNRNLTDSLDVHLVQNRDDDGDQHDNKTGNHFFNDDIDTIDEGETKLVKMDLSRFEQVHEDDEDEHDHDAKFILPD